MFKPSNSSNYQKNLQLSKNKDKKPLNKEQTKKKLSRKRIKWFSNFAVV